MKFSTIMLGVSLWACLVSCADADGGGGGGSARASSIHLVTFPGSPIPRSWGTNKTTRGRRPSPRIPTGKPSGRISPSCPGVHVNKMDSGHGHSGSAGPPAGERRCGGKSITFDTSTVTGPGGKPSEPSGAKAREVIFTTANWFAAASLDDGATFHQFDPTVYSGPANPATDGGFCCDQQVQYLPRIDRFAWVMVYQPNDNGANRLRILTFRPHDIDASGIKSWIYLDLFSTQFGLNQTLDFPDLAVGDHFLHVSATGAGQGLIVMRIPFTALNAVGPLTAWYTNPALGAPAYLGHISQNPGDTLFWGGHTELGTTMRIFKWPEAVTTYFWSDIRIHDWPADEGKFLSPCPGDPSTNWVFGQFGLVVGITRRSAHEVWFAWAASPGDAFPNMHIQIAQIDTAAWPVLKLAKQWQIWSADFAFAYPALSTNPCGDVGLAVGFGGGSSYPSSALGVADSDGLSSGLWHPELSDVCEDRWGDFLTVRPGDGMHYSAFVFAQQSTPAGVAHHARYVQFGRT